jgi:N-acetylneuraminic acid mutarotase
MGKSPRLALVIICMFSIFLSSCGTSDESAVGRGNLWTWKGGPKTINTTNQFGVYGLTTGTLGTPGARFNAVSLTDTVYDMWLFGGNGYAESGPTGRLNDLWVSSDGANWTWVSGSKTINNPGIYGTLGTPDAGNVPGAREGAISWIDASNNLWIFGGQGYDSAGDFGYLNDLWKFNVSTLKWTWVSGSDTRNQKGTYSGTRVPGGRSGAISMMDVSGNLQFFGGYGYDSAGDLGYLNDRWKFDVIALTWTWLNPTGNPATETNVRNRPGIYGTLGTPDAANMPGARSGAVWWADASNNLWLFGGQGYGSVFAAGSGELNDLWMQDAGTGIWTWKSGSKTINNPGIYGTLSTPDAGNVPGGRDGALSWRDMDGNLWLFSGHGYDKEIPISTQGYLNDLWRYDGTNWTWIKGSDTKNQSGIYGDHMGLPLASTVPGARSGSVKWIINGYLFMFGGFGYDTMTTPDYLNDVWRYR